MNRVPNTYRFSARPINRVAVPQLGGASVLRTQTTTFDGIARGAITFVPSWIYLAMILMAASAICITVNLRGRTEASSAVMQFNQLSSDIEAMRRSNSQLELEVRQITSEPGIIESAARARLGMVRPTDIVVPIKSQSGTSLTTLSLVR